MNNYRNFRNYRSPRLLTDPHCTYLGRAESIEKSSLRLTSLHSVTTSGLLSPSCKRNCNRLGLSQTVGIHPGSTSDTWETERKSNFRFTVAMDDCNWN